MKKNKILLYAVILISIIMCIPSIIYLIDNKTVDGFDAYYTFTLVKSNNMIVRCISGIVVIGLLLIFALLYFKIIKKQDKIFKNMREIWIFIITISFIFTLILPFLSSDVYYYIGDAWLDAKYGENPYYTTVGQLQEAGINDEMLDNTGPWKNTTSVYGPLWSLIAKLFVSLSFGNVTIALFIFKIASFFIHILSCYFMYKLTKSKKYLLLYAINPLVLIEFLSNVHNDIYLVFFIIVALYFLIRKKNIYLTMIFLALSVAIKYSTALLVPFVLIYCFRDKTIGKRILYCLISGLSIIALVAMFYLPYFKDYTIFINMLALSDRYSQSIMLLLMLNLDSSIYSVVDKLRLPIFVIIYMISLIVLLFKKKIKMKDLMKSYNYIMLIVIFLVLTLFQKWYFLWLLPTIMWQSKKMKKFIIYLTITALIPSINYFLAENDAYTLGVGYSLAVLLLAGILIIDKKK